MAYDVTVIRVLESLAEELSELNPTFRRITHAHSIISTLWTYRALYTLRHEYWAMQGCMAAATSLLFHLQPGSAEVDSFVKACQGLSELSEHLPLAKPFLAVIRELVARHGIRIPANGSKVLLSSARGRGSSYVNEARVAMMVQDAEASKDTRGLWEIRLSDLIRDVEELDILD